MCGPKFCSMRIHSHLEELKAKDEASAPRQVPAEIVR